MICKRKKEEFGESLVASRVPFSGFDGYVVMVSVTVVECDIDPLVPVTVTVNVPSGAFLPAVKVSVDVPVPPEESVTVTGLKVAVVLFGRPVAESVTAPLNPFSDVSVMVVLAEDRCRTITEDGEALMLKSGG